MRMPPYQAFGAQIDHADSRKEQQCENDHR